LRSCIHKARLVTIIHNIKIQYKILLIWNTDKYSWWELHKKRRFTNYFLQVYTAPWLIHSRESDYTPQRSVTHESLRYINIFTYLLTYNTIQYNTSLFIWQPSAGLLTYLYWPEGVNNSHGHWPTLKNNDFWTWPYLQFNSSCFNEKTNS